eukprot:s4045_g3.t1
MAGSGYGQAMNCHKAWRRFIEQTGGWQYRQCALTHVLPHPKAAGDAGGSFMSSLTEEDVDPGFQFISEQARNRGSEWKEVTWIAKKSLALWRRRTRKSLMEFTWRASETCRGRVTW